MSLKNKLVAVAQVSSMFACALGAEGPGSQSPNSSSAPPYIGGQPSAAIRKLDVAQARSVGAVFVRNGEPFCFMGANNDYVSYAGHARVTDLYERARAMGIQVVRTYAFVDRGSLDGRTKSVDGNGTKEGVFFQYWDAAKQRVAFNDGPTGLEHLDYAVAEAKKQGVQLTLVLTNNWTNFGGMNQYLEWFNLSEHGQFYTDSRARRAYQAYVRHLLERVNTVTGVAYKDEPAIFSWELANDPRCSSGGAGSSRETCSEKTITAWADEMSRFIHSVDPNHLVGVGDAGFFANDPSSQWVYNGSVGVDHEALVALSGVDYATFQLYPDLWRATHDWGNTWISQHIDVAVKQGKPTLLSEYGVPVLTGASDLDGAHEENDSLQLGLNASQRQATRRIVYDNWNRTMILGGGSSAFFWRLVGDSSADNFDSDGFAVVGRSEGDTDRFLSELAEQYSTQARACSLATERNLPLGAASPFVTVAAAALGGPKNPEPASSD